MQEKKNFKLVKINIDNFEELTEMLNISSVPTVFLVYKGNVVDSFVGFPDEKKLNSFFESVDLLVGLGKDEQIMHSLLAGADEYMRLNQYERAENMLNEAFCHQKWRSKYAHIIKLGLALCAFQRGDLSVTEKFIKDIKNNHKLTCDRDHTVKKKLALLEVKLMYKKNPDLQTKKVENINEELEKNPKDMNLRFDLAVICFENSDYEKAVDNLLEILQIDRNWNGKAAQQLLVQIFNYLGSDNELTIESRKKMTKILF